MDVDVLDEDAPPALQVIVLVGQPFPFLLPALCLVFYSAQILPLLASIVSLDKAKDTVLHTTR